MNNQLMPLLRIIKPVCRFAIKNSFRIQEIVEACKRALVEIAIEEIEKKGDQVSVSRVTIMTGVHRALVDEIIKGKDNSKKNPHIINRVIDKWQSDPLFCSRQKKPFVLKLDGMESPFIQLIQSISTELNPYTVLFELERVGVVKRTSHGIKLLKSVYLTKDKIEGYQFLSEDTDDLIQAVQENLEDQNNNPNLHLKTEYDNIPSTCIPQIKNWLLKEGSLFHKKARNFLSSFDSDAAKTSLKNNKSVDKAFRVAVGTFSVTTPSQKEKIIKHKLKN